MKTIIQVGYKGSLEKILLKPPKIQWHSIYKRSPLPWTFNINVSIYLCVKKHYKSWHQKYNLWKLEKIFCLKIAQEIEN